MKRLFCKNNGTKNNEKGMVLVLVLCFFGLMIFSTVSLSTMIQQDVRLIGRVKEKEQARFVAEAGINHALAKIVENGFSSRSNFTGSLDTGSYSVVHSTVGGRYKITSTGTVSGVTETVEVEVRDNTPTALNYFSGAGNDIKFNALIAGCFVTGDIHANNNVYVKAGPVFGLLEIDGDVSASGYVKEGKKLHDGNNDWWDDHVFINSDGNDTATVYESQDNITFPTFDYEYFKQLAIDSGDYYSGNTTFNGETLSPGNGIVYVDGDANFHGTCTLNGGVIADDIQIRNTLNQNKAGNINVIIAKDGDISVRGRLYTEEALVYASEDITSLQVMAFFEVNGILLAARDIDMWNVLTYLEYTYVLTYPTGMTGVDGRDPFEVVSWNK